MVVIFLERAVVVLRVLFGILQHRYALVGQLAERTPSTFESPTRSQSRLNATERSKARVRLLVNASFVYGVAGNELSDSSHVHVSHLQRLYFAVGDRVVEAHAIGINGDSVHGARGHVLEKE